MIIRRPWLRWALVGAATLFGLVVVAAVTGLLWLFSSLPQTAGRLNIEALQQPVSVTRDGDGIPHIEARSPHDAYVALGFVHAQDRLWQMEATRRVGAGRLAEILGGGFVATDKVMRGLGLYRRAEDMFANAPDDVRAALKAYAAGVNAYLAAPKGALPPEYYLLRFRPEPWRPADSLVWGQLMGLRLAGDWREELARLGLATRLNAEQIAALLDDRGDGPVSIEQPRRAARAPDGANSAPPATSLPPAMITQLADLLPPWVGPSPASNSWVIAGERTIGGKPLLANDPHLALDIPNTWYLAKISAPGLRLAGATAPGVPFHIIGHNDRIAWGVTNTGSDVQDLYVEKLDPRDSGRYLTPNGTQPFSTRHETILPRGGAPVSFTVRETRHGPVISDLLDGLPPGARADEVLAFASPGLRDDDRTAEALYRINRAGDWREFTEALRHFHYPQQNIAYADTAGNIGLYVAGRVPIRGKGDGALPAPGWSGDYDWTGFVPFESLPHSYNPPNGRLINANNRVVRPDYPYALGRRWEEPYRAMRIEQLIDARPRHDMGDMLRMQSDSTSLAAPALLRLLMPMAESMADPTAQQSEARALLAAWNGDADMALPQPLIFTAWLRELNRLIYADELGDDFARLAWSLRPSFIADVLTRSPQWCDNIATAPIETCEGQVQAAFRIALDRLAATYGAAPARWRWGDAHRVTLSHRVFGRLPIVGPWLDVVLATPGDDFTINRGSSSIRNEARPFAHVHGATLRAVYDLQDLAASRFMIAGGQSGNPLSETYANMAGRWRDAATITLDAPRNRGRTLHLAPPRGWR